MLDLFPAWAASEEIRPKVFNATTSERLSRRAHLALARIGQAEADGAASGISEAL